MLTAKPYCLRALHVAFALSIVRAPSLGGPCLSLYCRNDCAVPLADIRLFIPSSHTTLRIECPPQQSTSIVRYQGPVADLGGRCLIGFVVAIASSQRSVLITEGRGRRGDESVLFEVPERGKDKGADVSRSV